jgi:hypothetical protein
MSLVSRTRGVQWAGRPQRPAPRRRADRWWWSREDPPGVIGSSVGADRRILGSNDHATALVDKEPAHIGTIAPTRRRVFGGNRYVEPQPPGGPTVWLASTPTGLRPHGRIAPPVDRMRHGRPPREGSAKLHPCNPSCPGARHRRRAGAGRSGGADRVSPVGLASCLSSAVKASTMAGASNARLRRRTLT